MPIVPEREACFYNALARVVPAAHRTLTLLRRRFGAWERAWNALDMKTRGSIDPETEYARLEKEGVRVMLFDDPRYPALLREIPNPPHALYIQGRLPPRLAIAVVGTRKANEEGLRNASEVSAELTRAGITIVSGLAFGIDAAAHRACLEEKGRTVAVIATGLNRLYPRRHRNLAERILGSGGGIVAEYPLDAPALPYRFLERNRIVSGLSRAVVVVQAPQRSGACSTACHAAEQGREVFVLPGAARDARFAGSHALIRDGARLVTCAHHILEDLRLPIADPLRNARFSSEEAHIAALFTKTKKTLTIDKVAELTRLSTQTASQVTSLLFLNHAIEKTTFGYRRHARDRRIAH